MWGERELRWENRRAETDGNKDRKRERNTRKVGVVMEEEQEFVGNIQRTALKRKSLIYDSLLNMVNELMMESSLLIVTLPFKKT